MRVNAEAAYLFRHTLLRDAAYPATRATKLLRSFVVARSGRSQA